MFRWLHERRLRRLPLQEFLAGWISGTLKPSSSTVWDRARESVDSTLDTLHRLAPAHGHVNEAERFLEVLSHLALDKNPHATVLTLAGKDFEEAFGFIHVPVS